MGEDIRGTRFSREDEACFRRRLRRETDWLGAWLAENPDEPCTTIGGLELEAWLVNDRGDPVPTNQRFLAELGDPAVVPEIGAYNVEFNAPPARLTGDALSTLHGQLVSAWDRAEEEAGREDLALLMIGMLPSLRREHLHLDQMTGRARYHALNDRILAQRGGEPLHLRIQGDHDLSYDGSNVMMEAALTSFQVHLQARQSEMVRIYNAALIAAAPIVAATCNSPYVFDQPVWQESRIPIFEQVFATPADPPRVSLGPGYLERSLFELLEDNATDYAPLLPQVFDDGVDALHHVRLQNGAIWRWVRPVIDVNGGRPLLRIEHRVIPAGPTLRDCMANAVLTWGLLLWLGRRPVPPEELLPFSVARDNFARAARFGLAAEITWLDGKRHAVGDVLRRHLPDIRNALLALELDRPDVDRWLAVLDGRLRTGQTGASWQRRWSELSGRTGRALTRAYLARQRTGLPVHAWSTA